MKTKYIFLYCLLFICNAVTAQKVITGAEQMDRLLPILKGKRVALVVNQTSKVGETHLLDTLLAAHIQIKKVFAPEHGFRGDADAGETIRNGKDTRTGIPILSLYGKNKKPTATQLQDIDLIVFDIQDVGARFYTYISTMQYVMEACAENRKQLVITDRPNPCDYVDGPVRQKNQKSFVGMHAIPILHGCTVGELAQMINGEGWLPNGKKCALTVIPVEGWKHGQPYSLPVKPSPNLPNDQAIRLYPSLCFFEATNISVGRGTFFPFQVIGYPDKKYGEFSFTPEPLPGFDTKPLQNGKTCYGVDLRELPFEGGLTLRFLLDFYKMAGKDQAFFFSRPSWFDLLAGTKQLRYQIIRGMSEKEIRDSWKPELDNYRKMRKKYLLYKDYPVKK